MILIDSEEFQKINEEYHKVNSLILEDISETNKQLVKWYRSIKENIERKKETSNFDFEI
ncbi:MAG: hypothetical protein ACD_4C00384G0004 [uncultured bacterium (gcode 4)]|uniref:GGDEF domain-containing protein n=1 Tax=uncultured bacterium (gcode 4) TaxID=1234023 RepID=K2FTJ5_9BACT|nr:MAG: hypothetical protein ACD_4C00384G0004 [uncultured bacterium (gcode 4)]